MLLRVLRCSLLALGVVGSVGAGCSPALAPHASVAPATPPAPAVTAPVAAEVAAPASPPDPTVWDPASVTLLLDDPRLAAVKASVDREAYAKAAQDLAALTAASPALSLEDKREWLYQLGRLRALAGDPAGSAKAFQDAASSPWALSDYAHLQAAQALVGLSQFDAALTEAKAISGDTPIASALDLVLADALLGKKDIDAAAVRLRAYLAREKRPSQWVSVALKFAGALLQRPSEAHAEEAVRLARRVIYESPGGAGVDAAKDIEKSALATLPRARRAPFEHPSADDLLARARGLASAQQGREAVLVTDKLVKLPRAKKPSDFACDVWLVRADALLKMRGKKTEAADAYKDAIDRCAGQPRRVEALFAGGRASAQAGRSVNAMHRYALVETEFPKHRLADDARLRGARAALDSGDEGRFAQMLATIADDYPTGDLATDGLFELALLHIRKREWAGAMAPLEKALAKSPHEHAYYAAGRLPYYLARAHIETGAVAQGASELAAVVRDYPLSFYMALAHARLAERDPKAAAEAVDAGFAREPAGVFTVPRGAWCDDPAFLRALALVRQGEGKLVRAELDRVAAGARTASVDVQWAAAFLLSRAGAITQSHGLLRAGMTTNAPQGNELVEWLDHYPAGRWRAPWEIAYPRPWHDVVAAQGARQKLPEAWAYAIMREESAFEPHAASPAKAYGLMQLILSTAKRMATPLGLASDEDALKRPEINIALGCRYLSILRGQFPDNPLLAIPGYNAGGGAPKKWLTERPGEDFDVWVERIPYEETRQYTKRVITSLAAYELMYERGKPSEALAMPLLASPAGGTVVAASP